MGERPARATRGGGAALRFISGEGVRLPPMVLMHDPMRPRAVAIGAGMLLLAAAVLTLGWALGFEAVRSNGARVFFVALWAYLGYTAYGGQGWARHAILAVFVAKLWGVLNAPSVGAGMATLTATEAVAEALALAALVALWLPSSRRWFNSNVLRMREEVPDRS